MAQFFAVFEKMVELFLVMAAGYVANKVGIFDKTGRTVISGLVINIGCPTIVIASVMLNADAPTGWELGKCILLSSLCYVIMIPISLITPKILGVKEEERGQTSFGLLIKNNAFMGYPVAQAVFGPIGVFYAMIANLPSGILGYSLGLSMIRGKSDKKFEWSPRNVFLLAKDIFWNPPMIASVIAIILALIGVRRPVILAEAFQISGQITTPLALMIVGSSLADLPLKGIFNGVKIYLAGIVSMLITPAICYILINPLMENKTMLGVAVLMAGMPVAAAGCMLCVQCRKDETYMAKYTFITTVCSVITIPIVAGVMQAFQGGL